MKTTKEDTDARMIGKKFGRLTVLERTEPPLTLKRKNGPYYACLCDCGNKTRVQGSNLRSGNITSCGCYRREKNQEYDDLSGMIFGKLSVTRFDHKDKDGYACWFCECECGEKTIVKSSSLLCGLTRSCGCLRKTNKHTILNPEAPIFNKVLSSYKSSAKKRKLEFLLDIDYFKKLITSNCFYCGASPDRVITANNRTKEFRLYNGIDRLDNSKGYIENNCVTCCKVCNYAKGQMGETEFYNWVNKIYVNLKDKKLIS